MSADGSVIVGIGSGNSSGSSGARLVRWQNGTITDTGLGGQFMYYRAMSVDGSVIIGFGMTADDGEMQAFRWENNTTTVLSLGGVQVVMQPSMPMPMASVAPTPSSPVVTHADGSQSFAIKDDNSSYGMFTPVAPSPLSRLSVYTVGSVGFGQDNNFDNHDVNGTVGASVHITNDIAVGVGILGATSHTNMAYNGKSDLSARGVSTVFSYAPQYGFRAFATAFIADLDLTIDRGYLNGNSAVSSRGTPDGNAHGVAAEFGYAVPVNKQTTITPFVDARWSKTSIDAYSETGGPFDADFSTQKSTNVTSHLGSELGYQLNPKVNLYTRASWAHRLSGDGQDFTATTSGVTQSLGLDPGDKNWFEGTVGMNYQASEKIRLSAEISGRTGVTQEPVTTITVGANISF